MKAVILQNATIFYVYILKIRNEYVLKINIIYEDHNETNKDKSQHAYVIQKMAPFENKNIKINAF